MRRGGRIRLVAIGGVVGEQEKKKKKKRKCRVEQTKKGRARVGAGFNMECLFGS